MLRQAYRPADEFEAGSVVDGYVIGWPARGGVAERVYHAHAPDGEPVAIVASAASHLSRDDRPRFRRLVRARVEVQHPALLPVYGCGEHGRTRYLVTAPYPPRTLADEIGGAPMEPRAAVELLAPVADALHLCHARGLVHQQLGAESLLMDGDRAVLDAFGLAAIGSESWSAFEAGPFRYGTPEAVQGELPEPAANVYSLTSVLVHMLTGRPPYPDTAARARNAAWAAAMVHATAPPPRPSEHVPALGREIDEAIAWGMAKDPADRPQSTIALLEAVGQALGIDPWAGRAPSRVDDVADARRRSSLPRSSPRRSWLGRVAGVAVVAAAGIAAGVAVDPFGGDSPSPSQGPSDTALVRTLDEGRAALRSELAEATDPSDQAAAASELASLYRRTAARAEGAALQAASWAAAGAYADLATAARDNDPSAFARAGEDVEEAELALAEAAR